MEHDTIFVLFIVILSTFNNEVQAGYCQKTYSCSNTCYTSVSYYERCGPWLKYQCIRYRVEAGTCYSLCYTQECCLGYTGNLCSTPICSQSCSSNGYCSSPETCTCNSGYKLLSDGRTCEDINECATGTSSCQHGCTNTKGSFECSCNIGYELSWDRKSCNDIDECSRGTSGCQQNCTNTPGSYTCSCNTGFQIGIDGKSCSDIDECSDRTAVCEGFCVNTNGSYQCSCGSGYVLAADGKTCHFVIDIDECSRGTSGCQQSCTNTPGSYTCSCNTGFQIDIDGKSCSDIDECSRGTSDCQQSCTNTPGSYTCSCNTGFQIDIDGKSCSDIDECSRGTSGCQQSCTNTPGSYTCSCNSGFQIGIDGKSCSDVNECNDNNGGCQQDCNNKLGSYECKCRKGFEQISTNKSRCIDIDECTRGISGCSQQCKNSEGSYTCSCKNGYQLLKDGKTCTDIDDCMGVVCRNGGTCIDGLDSYVCSCSAGFTSDHCELDVNECGILNGGCQEACVNTDGSFHCACFNGKQIAANGVSCSTDEDIKFDCDSFSWEHLPVACFPLTLSLGTNGNDHSFELKSTSQWYSKNENHSIYFTFGITFVQVDSLSLPISLRGVEVTLTGSQFQLRHGVSYKSSDGSILEDANNQNQCQTFELVESDIFNYISCGSFFKTFLTALFPSLPDWISFDKSSDSVLAVQGMKSDLAWGRDINDILWCKGAPTFDDHLYSVFQFDSTFSLEVLGQQLHIPKPLYSRKFCLIIDIFQESGKTIFLMIPEESRNMLEQLNFFRNLKEEKNIRVFPRGIGLSLEHGINVPSKPSSLQLWNGDTIFQYPIFKETNIWIGGDVALTTDQWNIDGSIDAFLNVPSINNLLTSIFYDEWNAYISASTKIQFKFDLFGKRFTLVLKQKIDSYMSIGGQKRLWCGDESNPPGFFFTVDFETSLFKGIPILEDSVISVAHKAYAFATSEPPVEVIDFDEITEKEVVALQSFLQNISLHLEETAKSHDIILRNTTKIIISDILSTISDFRNTIDSDSMNSFVKVKQIFEKSLGFLIKLTHHIELFLRETEGNVVMRFNDLKNVVKYELSSFKFNLNEALAKISRRLFAIQPNFSGFGLKYTAKLNVLGINLGVFEIELVKSTDSLFKCSRFQKIIDYLKGEEALRLLARAYQPKSTKLNAFFKLEGRGVGGAFSSVSDKFVIQLEVNSKIVGIATTADLFITKNGLYLYIEGKVWDIFLAQIDVFAETGKQWHELSLKASGQFVVKDRKKRQIQTVSSFFDASYLDGLKKAIAFVADNAKTRLTRVQDKLTSVQNAFTKAQNWLEEKQKDVKKAEDKLTQAVLKLEIAQQNLEKAKGPFQEALRKLESAQRNVDNLCTITTCNKVCVPGARVKMCGGWVKYPCVKWTNCMIRLPDPLCVAANLLCRTARTVAYAALDAAKIFVKAPMLALDIAKAAVSVSQVVVDKSRVLLSVANGILEIANTRLEFAKGVLEAAKLAVEGVKLALGAAVKVLNLVIEFGVQNLIDVRKCGFEIELTTKDLPVFEVFCEVNAFHLGWRKITFIINFKNILQSLWNAARATIESLMKLIGDVIGRKRREVTFRSAKQVHDILRIIRSADNTTNSKTFIYESLDVTNSIFGFRNDTDSDYENRKILFEGKCVTTTRVLKFLQVAFEELQKVANKSIQTIKEIESQKVELENFNSDGLSDNLTLDNAGIDPDYALTDYNITADDLEILLNQTKAEISKNPLLQEINDAVNASIQNLNSQLEAIYAVDFREAWLLALANLSVEYFNTSECMGFQDCVMYAMSLLYDAFESADLPNIELTQQTLLDVELAFIELFQNKSSKITETSASIDNIIVKVYSLQQTNQFCSVAPYFQSEQSDQTVLVGSDVVLLCDASGDPVPVFWWYKDDTLMENEEGRQIILSNVSLNDSGTYYCIAGNIVANISSNESFLLVITHDDDECQTNNGGCEQHCKNTVGSFKCNCDEGYALNYDGRTCIGSRQREDKLSTNTIALIASMSVLGLVVVAAIGTVAHIKLGKQKMTKVSDLKDKYKDIFVEEFTPVEVIAPGPLKTVFSTHHQFHKGAEAGNIFDH